MSLAGVNFDITIIGTMIHIESASATINDESAVATTRGVTTGYTFGKATCDVELIMDIVNFKKYRGAVSSEGSWRSIKPHDMMFYANDGEDEDKVELFGVKPLLSDLIKVDPNSSDKTTRTVKGFVTSPHFVRLNGKPYLSSYDTRGIIG